MNGTIPSSQARAGGAERNDEPVGPIGYTKCVLCTRKPGERALELHEIALEDKRAPVHDRRDGSQDILTLLSKQVWVPEERDRHPRGSD